MLTATSRPSARDARNPRSFTGADFTNRPSNTNSTLPSFDGFAAHRAARVGGAGGGAGRTGFILTGRGGFGLGVGSSAALQSRSPSLGPGSFGLLGVGASGSVSASPAREVR